MAARTRNREEFHQLSHLALKRASTLAVETLCRFSMVMSGVALREKCRLICSKEMFKNEEGDGGEKHVREQ